MADTTVGRGGVFGCRRLVNLQSVNGEAKPYQVKQLLDLIDRYNLKLEAEP
jgi:hypothetical protein